jgi:hypothetical protein
MFQTAHALQKIERPYDPYIGLRFSYPILAARRFDSMESN